MIWVEQREMIQLSYHMRRTLKIVFLLFLAVVLLTASAGYLHQAVPTQGTEEKKADYIKYVEFNVPYLALKKAMNMDIASHKEGGSLNWIEILAYLGAKYGGNFTQYKSKDMDAFVEKLETSSVEEITKDMKYYNYYFQAYSAVLGGLLGKYREDGEEKYGLIGYSPIAKNFPYTDCDDFGARRTYGYSRPHLGHDMMAATGTPVIAVESGLWRRLAGTSTADGESAFAVLTPNDITIMHICAKTDLMLQGWPLAKPSKRGTSSDMWGAQDTAPKKTSITLKSAICILGCSSFLTKARKSATMKSGWMSML
jgi:hypothetical protein